MTNATMSTVLFSGGIDSAACAHLLLERNLKVDGLFVDFGQAAAPQEHLAAVQMSKYLAIPLRRVAVTNEKSFGTGELVGRNAFLAFVALLFSGGRSGVIGLGLHAGTAYYDCSQSFLASLTKFVSEHTDGRVSVVAPFVSWTKRDVFDYFKSSNLPITYTYSCEAGNEAPCGLCASCLDRKALGC